MDNNWTHRNPFWVFFLGEKINDIVNKVSVIFNLIFLISEDLFFFFHLYLSRSSFQLDLRLKMKSRQSISSSEYFPIITFSIFVTKISEMSIRNRLRLVETHVPQKTQYLKNKFSPVTLISFGIWVLICKKHLKGYLHCFIATTLLFTERFYWFITFCHSSPLNWISLHVFFNGSFAT